MRSGHYRIILPHAANTISTAKHNAATGVNHGSTSTNLGKKIPNAPKISLIPMNRMMPADNPSTPV